MTGDAAREERREMKWYPYRVCEPSADHQHKHRDKVGKQTAHNADNPSPRAGKRKNEAQQVNGQRNHPQQGDRGQISRQISRHPHQPARGNEDEDKPSDQIDCRHTRPFPAQIQARPRQGRVSFDLNARQSTQAASGDTTDQNQKRQKQKPSPPDPALFAQTQSRLDQERIGQKRHQAAGIARGIEEIRIARSGMRHERKPALK